MWERYGLASFIALIFLAGALSVHLSQCGEPEDEEGSAVLCDFLCISLDDGTDRCEWYCEDPEVEVSCNFCEYTIRSGDAVFTCRMCDVGTY